MGTYACLFAAQGAEIPKKRRNEFRKRIEKLFQAGGAIEFDITELGEREVVTIDKAKMYEDGMDFCYNYFDDDIHENAGFDRGGCCVWSEKIGTGASCAIIIAAYVLEALYIDEFAYAMVNGEAVEDTCYAAWINHLFGDYLVPPLSTSEFLEQSPDDMIAYWEENSDIVFSNELWLWFDSLKCRFESLMKEDFVIENPLEYMADLMEEADESYFRIFTFTDFLTESVKNKKKKKYLSLWKLYEELIRSPELLAAGSVIFAEDVGVEHMKINQNEELDPFYERDLIRNWYRIDREKRYNLGRVTLRRYMALVANKPLRAKVFGF